MTTKPELSGKHKRALRGQAHRLSPVVRVGKHGLTDAVVAATREALEDHELIKVRIDDDREEREATAAALSDSTGAAVVGIIGGVAILYRPHADPEQRRTRLE